jgi:hypothetical protein
MQILIIQHSVINEGMIENTEVISGTHEGLIVQQVASYVADLMERGCIPVDNWMPFINISSGSGISFQFMQDIVDELSNYTVDV